MVGSEPSMTSIQGHCQPRFAAVKEQFLKNFSTHSEIGASVCVIVDGATVAHLWGGKLGSDTDQDWNDQTVVNVFSCTKGALALSTLLLLDSGDIELDAPVCRYWPEFGQKAKENITVRMLLHHQAGLPAVRESVTLPELYDLEHLPRLLEKEDLFWEPGTQHGYHAVTFGALVDELFRRIAGQNVGAFFQQEIAGPLGLDFWIGLPESIEPRVAPVIFTPPAAGADSAPVPPESQLAGQVRPALELLVMDIGSRKSRAIGFPAGGGIASASGLAGMYAPLSQDGAVAGHQLVREETVASMAAAKTVNGMDAVLSIHTSFVNGFTRSWGHYSTAPGQGFAIGEQAFGHPGMGGSVGFADPKHRLAFAFVMNRMNGQPSLDARAQGLIDAVYQSLGLESRGSGCWK